MISHFLRFRMSRHSTGRESGLFPRTQCFPGKLQWIRPTMHTNSQQALLNLTASLQEKCLERGCCWETSSEANVPWCFFSTSHGYSVVSQSTPDSTREFSLNRDVIYSKSKNVQMYCLTT